MFGREFFSKELNPSPILICDGTGGGFGLGAFKKLQSGGILLVVGSRRIKGTWGSSNLDCMQTIVS
jgi:hypothetical protein